MRRIDRFVNAVRAAVEEALPWYDRAEAAELHDHTEAIAERSRDARRQARETLRISFARADDRMAGRRE
jgi:hypothetical protein